MDYSNVYVHIVEQPATQSVRFRYTSEHRGGSLPGCSTNLLQRTNPSIRICNFVGPVVVVVSCVTHNAPFEPHPNQLAGPKAKYGVLTRSLEITEQCRKIDFEDLFICCMKKNEVQDSMELRKAKRVDPYKTGFRQKPSAKDYDLKALRICFQVFITVPKSNGSVHQLPIAPIVTEPIFDRRFACEMNISHISEASAPAPGGKKCMLFSGKISRDDIVVRFVERSGDKEIWTAVAEATSIYVHHQVAISFKVPPFRNEWIEQPTKSVMLHLYRPSDGVSGTAIKFTYTPDIDFMTKQQSMKRFRRNETQSRELYQLISDHLNTQQIADKQSPLRPLLNGNTFDRSKDISSPKDAKRKRQKEHRTRDLLQQIIDESLVHIYGADDAPSPSPIMYNIIKEESPSTTATPKYEANYNDVPIPTNPFACDVMNQKEECPPSTLPTPQYEANFNDDFIPTNPFACDVLYNNVINYLQDEKKPLNTATNPAPFRCLLTEHDDIFHDNFNGKDYKILTPKPTSNKTNPFLQYRTPLGEQHGNVFAEHLHSLDSRNDLPELVLNSNDLNSCIPTAGKPTATQENNMNILNNMTVSFSSLTM